MAHCAKFSKAGCGHMFKHFERAKDEKGEYIKFSNENIDTTRTHLNYNLAQNRESQGNFVRQRCEKIGCLNRKDVNVMCSWIVTAPKSLVSDEYAEKKFFQETYDFLEKRYGNANVVSAYVHMDEITPHIHFAFVPVVYDKEKDKMKVSAKECVSRHDLQTFHKDLDIHLLSRMGLIYQQDIMNGATEQGNRSIEELKRQSATERMQAIDSRAKKIITQAENILQKANDTAVKTVTTAEQGATKIRESIKPLQAQKQALEREIEQYQSLRGAVVPVKEKTKGFGEHKEVVEVTMDKQTYDACVAAQLGYQSMEFRVKQAEEQAHSLQQSASYGENAQLKQDLTQTHQENRGLRDKLRRANGEIEKVNKVFEHSPEVHQAFSNVLKNIQKEQNRGQER